MMRGAALLLAPLALTRGVAGNGCGATCGERATPIAAAGKAVAVGLPAFLFVGQLVQKRAEQSAAGGQQAKKGMQQPGNAFLFPEPRKGPK